MSSLPNLSNSTIAIWGLGLIGGSLALALQGKCARLIGIDPDPRIVELAQQKEIVDIAAQTPENVLQQANLIILAAPVKAIINQIHQIPEHHSGNAVALDVGSTKIEIINAMSTLPERFDPIGGHPMCGKEISSLLSAEKDLFTNAAFALTPLERTTPKAKSLVSQLVKAIGALPLWVDANQNDQWSAATSHLPYLIANALAAATPVEAAPLIGPGYQSTTRLAVEPPGMMMDILKTNRSNVLDAISNFKKQLKDLEEDLAQGDMESLKLRLESGAKHQKELLSAFKGAVQ